MALALSMASTIPAAPTSRPLQTRQTACTGISQIVLGEYCTTDFTAPGSDPVTTSCDAKILQLDNNNNIIGEGDIGSMVNQVNNNAVNTSDYCQYPAFQDDTTAVTVSSCDTTWTYRFAQCMNGTSIQVTQEQAGNLSTSSMATFPYDEAIQEPSIDNQQAWYSKFAAPESVFVQ